MALLGLVADYSSSEDEGTADLEETLTTKASKHEPTNFFETEPEDIEASQKKLKKCKKSKKEKHIKLMNPKKGLKKANVSGQNLPNPFGSNETTSVFYNPFHKEQEAKKLMLEKHVKLSENPKDVVEINGKKMCFNYRKGRCKFGHKCKYAHDSDLSVGPGGVGTPGSQTPQAALYNNGVPDAGLEADAEEEKNRKRKPGLSEGLVPNKRARQNFRSQQAQDAPWLAKR